MAGLGRVLASLSRCLNTQVLFDIVNPMQAMTCQARAGASSVEVNDNKKTEDFEQDRTTSNNDKTEESNELLPLDEDLASNDPVH